jgi:hypothetical protein
MDDLLRSLVEKKAEKHEYLIAFPSKSFDAIRNRSYKIGAGHIKVVVTKKTETVSKPRSTLGEITLRKCMACTARFYSEGPHHRLCAVHRAQSSDDGYRVMPK